MNWNTWVFIAALNGLLSVAAGAFGAHALRDRVESPRQLEVFETGAKYHMYHALALLAVAWLISRGATTTAQPSAWCFLIGITIFSGSLYGIGLTGINKLGMITPVGGLLLIIGWALLAWAALRTPTA